MYLHLPLFIAIIFFNVAASQLIPLPQPAAAPVTNTGGYSVISPESAGALNAAQYAVNEKYPAVEIDFEVMTAKMQVVAGFNYRLDVAVTLIGDETCSMQNFEVYQGFKNDYILKSSTALTSQECPSV